MTLYLLLIASLLLAALSGICKAIKDTLAHHYPNSRLRSLRPAQWWDASVSWKNKYRDYDRGDTRARFPGSKTILVAFTDAWHLFDNLAHLLVIITSVTAGVAVALQSHEANALLWGRAALVGLAQFASLVTAFHIAYHYILPIKNNG